MNGPFLSSILICLCCLRSTGFATDYHVAKNGDDHNTGTKSAPFLTINHAAALTKPGDAVIVHAGTYREWIAPDHGGTDEKHRITFRAAPGEQVAIKGSERISNWQSLGNGVWKVALPQHFFGDYNPYTTLIFGDWFFPWNIAQQQIAYVYYGNAQGFKPGIRQLHTGEVYLNGKALFEADSLQQVLQGRPAFLTFGLHDKTADNRLTWFTTQENGQTIIYAHFGKADPNKELTEINVRPTCFYPKKTGVNYITVSGFDMSQCASQWAAPTAEQIGCIGTNWSKGWIIEHNTIHDSKCVGITLGKDRASGQNPWSADPSKDGSLYYNEIVKRVIAGGWNKANIGSHIVRHNEIYHCAEAGICGSFGGAFSTIESNDVHDIYTRRGFYGAEMAGIKLHAAIDAIIRNNHVRNTYIGIWLDWMAQGTRISNNLVYGNDYVDFFPEVNHGPYVVDNNFFLSPFSVKDWSEGGAYLYNIMAGLLSRAPQSRATPIFQPHSTTWLDTVVIKGGDNRFYGNVFLMNNKQPFRKAANSYLPPDGIDTLSGYDLSIYKDAVQKNIILGNHYFPARFAVQRTQTHYLIKFSQKLPAIAHRIITSQHLGSIKVVQQPWLSKAAVIHAKRNYAPIKTISWSNR